MAQLIFIPGGDGRSCEPGYFDGICDYLPISAGSPDDIGPAVQFAFNAAALYGNNAGNFIGYHTGLPAF